MNELPAPLEISGPWQVGFDPRCGGPAQLVTFAKRQDWSQHTDPAIRYYSGTAVYRTTFRIPQSTSENPKSRLLLDLGQVVVMAEVKLNGRDLGILWKAPYRLDITEAAKTGEKAWQLKVVNLWINRQIGDEQLAKDSDRNPNGTLKSWPAWLEQGKASPPGRFSFTSWRPWKNDDPLQPSGLLGPVTLQTAVRFSLSAIPFEVVER